jgi:hypothetical protein
MDLIPFPPDSLAHKLFQKGMILVCCGLESASSNHIWKIGLTRCFSNFLMTRALATEEI